MSGFTNFLAQAYLELLKALSFGAILGALFTTLALAPVDSCACARSLGTFATIRSRCSATIKLNPEGNLSMERNWPELLDSTNLPENPCQNYLKFSLGPGALDPIARGLVGALGGAGLGWLIAKVLK